MVHVFSASTLPPPLLLRTQKNRNEKKGGPTRNEGEQQVLRLDRKGDYSSIRLATNTRHSRCWHQPKDPRSPSHVWSPNFDFPYSSGPTLQACSLTSFFSILQLPTTSGAKKMLASSLCSSVCTPPSKHAMSCGLSTIVRHPRYHTPKPAQLQDTDSRPILCSKSLHRRRLCPQITLFVPQVTRIPGNGHAENFAGYRPWRG